MEPSDEAVLAFVLERIIYLDSGLEGVIVSFEKGGLYPVVNGASTREAVLAAMKEDSRG